MDPARVWMPGGTKRSISSEMSRPQISAAGSCWWKNAREAALSAAHVQDPFAAQVSQMFADEFYVIDTRVDGGGKMFFVGCRLIE